MMATRMNALRSAAPSALGCQMRRISTANKYDWQDPFQMDDLLTDEEMEVRDTVRKFAQEELQPHVTQHYRDATIPDNLFKRFGELGLLGASLEGYGCAGVSSVAASLIGREIEKVDSGYRSAWSVVSSLVMYPIRTFGTEEQRQKYLPGLASGELIGCFGLTEPEAGSDPAGMKTTLEEKGDHFILNGSKMWITNSPIADVFVVWAKNTATGKLQGVILEKGMEGLAANKIPGKLSLRASITGDIHMDNVKVPKENVLQVEGFTGPFSCLNQARFGIAWGALGAAESCYAIARGYTLDRRQFGRPLASNQLVQKKLAEMNTKISLGLMGCWRASRMKDAGTLPIELISLLKRNSTIAGLEVAREARDMLGGNGIVDDYHVMRHVCNLETVHTYEGTADIHALIMGRAITGIPSF